MSHFCQLIQTMESELSMTWVNRCEVWTNPIRYFLVYFQTCFEFMCHERVDLRASNCSILWTCASQRELSPRLPIVPSLNLCITRGLIWETQFLYLLAGHWIYGTIYAFWWNLDSISWGPFVEWPFIGTHWILGFTIDFGRLNQLEDLGVLFFHSSSILELVWLCHIFNPCCWGFF
jgi:hypothetical protein